MKDKEFLVEEKGVGEIHPPRPGSKTPSQPSFIGGSPEKKCREL